MFCKYCGKGIDPNTMRCRNCGRPVGPLAGGTGFWDLSGGASAPAQATDETMTRQMDELRKQIEELREQPKTERKAPSLLLPVTATLLAAVGLGFGVFTYWRGGQTQQETARLLAEQSAQIQTLQEQLASLDEEQKLPRFSDASVVISGPQSDKAYVGKVSSDGYVADGLWIFAASFQGSYGPYDCYWVKLEGDEADPDYVRVSDIGGYQEVTIDPSNSRLYIVGPVQESHFGRYAFMVKDGSGLVHMSKIAELVNEQPPTPQAGETAGGEEQAEESHG